MLEKEKRQQLLRDAGIKLEVGADDGLAMKSDLGIPWNKLRSIRRGLSSWGVQMASEKKQREVADKQKLGEILSEDMPFEFKKNGSGREIRMAPCARIQNLEEMVFNHLEVHKSSGNLVWHEGLIPSNEIWIKIGGDKGGGSFKMVFAIGNLQNPNSTRNTITFSMFEAGDTPYNLALGLQGYDSVIENLNGQKWGDWTMRVFLFGDYAFLCAIYGISGASGKHFCLWCLITQDEVSIPLSERGLKSSRTLQGIIDDNSKF
ncbi:uncharacterized protein LOC116305874 [Actinia tenebrosa]|uniref:Uncharacterized protein LOC116305874 n=1 Tax=Actinia tenebrosa TaxID=6105 RepID=A0A6P8J0M4_ACTTE|nr:uncharacterized protein LOC116305874 [Actinia tenebrosa]